MNWKEVPIPPLMAKLPKDKRGFPIPVIVVRDLHGEAVFTANNTLKVLDMLMHKRCGICGQKLHSDAWLVGGPMSAFHPHGAYLDPPMHHECGTYALQVCPYLAMTAYKQMPDEQRTDMLEKRFDQTVLFVDPTADPNRPEFFVFVQLADWKINERRYVIPQRPYLNVEFWKSGERIELARPPGDLYPI